MPAPEGRTRSLSYRRAVWVKPPSHAASLQTLVVEALDQFPNTEHTRLERGEQVVEIRHRLKQDKTSPTGPLTFLHVAAYTPKDATSTVPLTTGTANADLSSMPARAGEEFLDGNLMALIRGDDICLCTSNFSENGFQNYLFRLLRKLGYQEADLGFQIQKVANRKNLKKLVAAGVKQVTFDLVSYQESIKDLTQTPLEKFGSYLGSVFAEDTGIEDLLEQQGLQSYVTLKASGRVAHGSAQEALADFAAEIVDEEAEGFVIETKNGDRITPSELSVKRRVSIEKDAKTVKYSDAWQKLKTFYEYIDEQKLNQF